MKNDNDDANEPVPGGTAAALANAATICNEVIVASGNDKDEEPAKNKVNPACSVPADATKKLVVGNKKQVTGNLSTRVENITIK